MAFPHLNKLRIQEVALPPSTAEAISVVLAHAIEDDFRTGLFIEECVPSLPHSMKGEGEDIASRKVGFSSQGPIENLCEFTASCRDLMCFYDANVIYVYSPSTNQYLCYDIMVTRRKPIEVKIGLVYVASMNLYKVVKYELYYGSSSKVVRFEAITVPEEDYNCDNHQNSLWELICKQTLSSFKFLGNMIGLNGAVYAIAGFGYIPEEYETKVLYLGFDGQQQQDKFKMLSLPETACCDKGLCPEGLSNTLLCQVNNFVCYPHTHTARSCIDLWLLRDCNACEWFKGYSFTIPPQNFCGLEQFVYSPLPTTTMSDDADDAGAVGLYYFSFRPGTDFFQHDTRTKECTLLLEYEYTQQLHVLSDRLYSLKNGLSCSPIAAKMHSPPTQKLQQHKPPIKRQLQEEMMAAQPPPPPLIFPDSPCSLILQPQSSSVYHYQIDSPSILPLYEDPNKYSEVKVETDDGLNTDPRLTTPALPKELLIDAVSRLSAKDACKLKVLSKAWLFLISTNPEFKSLHCLRARQRPSLLVRAHAIEEDFRTGLFIEECVPSLPHSMKGEGEDFASRKVGFSRQGPIENLQGYFTASCRDLMCFYDVNVIYVYSPSTNQYMCYDTMVTHRKPDQWKIGLVYVASMNLYKVVKYELYGSCPAVRFEAITVPEEDYNCDDHRTSSWELICEQNLSRFHFLGNMIGVNGVVYAIAWFGYSPGEAEMKVLYLDFDGQQKQHKFKMLSLPPIDCCKSDLLCQVNNFVCYPHTHPGMSCIDLWLLRDCNACEWFKGYSFTIPPQHFGLLEQFVYSPLPTTEIPDDADDADAAGLYFFSYSCGSDFFQHDTRTKECTLLLEYEYTQKLLVFSNRLYSLKNGLSCSPITAKMHSPPTQKLQQHKPPIKRQLQLQMEMMLNQPIKRMALQPPPPPPICPQPPRSLSLPPQCSPILLSPSVYHYHIESLPPPQCSQPPLASYLYHKVQHTDYPPPQGSLSPPPSYLYHKVPHTEYPLPQASLSPPPSYFYRKYNVQHTQYSPPQGSLPPPSSYLYHKVQRTEYPPPQGSLYTEYETESLPPPLRKGIKRPRQFNPQDFQYPLSTFIKRTW